MKILLAVDGSDYTRKMLDYVAANTALFDAAQSYTLFHARPPLPGHASAAVGGDVTRDYHQEEAAKVLQPALAALETKGMKADSQWKAGQPGPTIAAFAKAGGYDMVIMGSHGHGALARAVMGSVAGEVLAECKVPLLLIR